MKQLAYLKGCKRNYILTSTGVLFSTFNGFKVMSTRVSNSGYEMVKVETTEKPKLCTMHRLVAMTFIPNPGNKRFVNHKDGNKLNNCADNLEWVTPSENSQHAYMNGLVNHRGRKNGNSKLTEDDINPIRKRINDGELLKDIAKDYDVHYSSISGIAHDKIWNHVEK